MTRVRWSRDGGRIHSFSPGVFTDAANRVWDAESGELLTDITIPNLPRGRSCFAYESFEQQASGYALVGVAAVLVLARRSVKHVALAFTGLADTPFVAEAAGQLVGTKGEADVIATVANAAVAGVEANDDIHAPADYRKHLGTVAARRAIARAIERAG